MIFLNGNVTPPPSKSMAHRALILGALTKSEFMINNVQLSQDIKATLEALKALGVSYKIDKDTITLDSSNIIENCEVTINANESGSTLRFFIPLSQALNNKTTFIGEGRLPKRPLDIYFKLFEERNINYHKPSDSYLPLTIDGKLNGGLFIIDGNISSQFITGIMLCAPIFDNDTIININPPFESKPYVDLTADILKYFGVDVLFNNNSYKITAGNLKKPYSYTVENDWSQAAFFLCGGAINGDITLNNMNLSSKQGDRQILEILKSQNAEIIVNGNEIRVKKSKLNAIDIDVKDIPDLVPILSVLACFCEGKTLIYNAARLRIKESDRLFAMYSELKKAGADITMGEDFLEIVGGKPLRGGYFSSHNDHRIAMSLAVLGACIDEKVIIDNLVCIDKSYPEFTEHFKSLGGKINE